MRLSLTRGARTSTAPAAVITSRGWCVAVAHHQPAPALVPLASQLGQVGVDLGLQRGGQHPPRTLPHDVVHQREPLAARSVLGDYSQHGRAFPTDAPTSA